MALNGLKKELNKMEKTEIIKLISELYKKVPEAKNYLDIYATGEIKELVEKYKKQIEKYIYPNRRNMDLRETEARKIIRTVRKMKITELNVELELHYVSCCLEIIEDFGYWDENYYIALGKMFDNAINGIYELGVQDKYNDKLILLSKSKASPCIVTLMLSFILSDYIYKIKDCKLKRFIINGYFLPTYEHPRGFSIR